MFFLNTNAKSLELVLGGAKATVDLPFTVTWADLTTTTFTPSANEGTTNGTTPVTIVVAPPTGTNRQIKFLSVYNADSRASRITVQINDGSERIILSPLLGLMESLVYDEHNGWQVLTSDGGVKTTSGEAVNMFAIGEVPSGTVNGTNPTFTLANTPVAGTVAFYIDGLRMLLGSDYTIASAVITVLTGAIPQTGDLLQADYQY